MPGRPLTEWPLHPDSLTGRLTMAEFSQNRSKRRDGEVLGGAVDFLLANARLVLGVGGAAVLGIATLAVKRVRLGWPADTDSTAGLGRWDCQRLHLPPPLRLVGSAVATQASDALTCVPLPAAH